MLLARKLTFPAKSSKKLFTTPLDQKLEVADVFKEPRKDLQQITQETRLEASQKASEKRLEASQKDLENE